jgi:hypothetical protein
VNPVPDPLLLRNSGSAGNRTRTSGSLARNSDHRGGQLHYSCYCQGPLILFCLYKCLTLSGLPFPRNVALCNFLALLLDISTFKTMLCSLVILGTDSMSDLLQIGTRRDFLATLAIPFKAAYQHFHFQRKNAGSPLCFVQHFRYFN